MESYKDVTLELYTYQPLNFNLVKHKVNLDFSPHYGDEDPCFRENFCRAYDFLFEKAGRKNNIWCYGAQCLSASRNKKYQCFEPQRLWVLDVPDKHVIAVDSAIWDFALNNWYYLNEHVYGTLTAHIADNDAVKQAQFDKLLSDLYDGNPFNSYKGLIKPLKTADRFYDQFLIPSPIKRHWVVRTYIIQAEAKVLTNS